MRVGTVATVATVTTATTKNHDSINRSDILCIFQISLQFGDCMCFSLLPYHLLLRYVTLRCFALLLGCFHELKSGKKRAEGGRTRRRSRRRGGGSERIHRRNPGHGDTGKRHGRRWWRWRWCDLPKGGATHVVEGRRGGSRGGKGRIGRVGHGHAGPERRTTQCSHGVSSGRPKDGLTGTLSRRRHVAVAAPGADETHAGTVTGRREGGGRQCGATRVADARLRSKLRIRQKASGTACIDTGGCQGRRRSIHTRRTNAVTCDRPTGLGILCEIGTTGGAISRSATSDTATAKDIARGGRGTGRGHTIDRGGSKYIGSDTLEHATTSSGRSRL